MAVSKGYILIFTIVMGVLLGLTYVFLPRRPLLDETDHCMVKGSTSKISDEVYTDKKDAQIAKQNIETGTKTKKLSKQELMTKEILEKYFGPDYIVNTRPDWMKGYKGANLEIDFFYENLSLSVEVQGEQHFKPGSFGKTDEDFAYRYACDIHKARLCHDRKVTLIHVLYFQDTKEKIIKQLRDELKRAKRSDLLTKLPRI